MFDVNESIFEDSEFKEDSVREEIVAPIIKRLGYSASGDNRVVRSKSLTHPFVMIGSKKHKINIVPDYALEINNEIRGILDAKSPSEKLSKNKHIEQAYSYAIHPEVRCRYYSLCNGKQLVIYDVGRYTPVLEVDFKDIDRRWDQIQSLLGPRNLSRWARLELNPDLGMAISKFCSQSNMEHIFPLARISSLTFIGENTLSSTESIPFGNDVYAVTFDFPDEVGKELTKRMHAQDIAKLDGRLKLHELHLLSRP